MQEPCFEFVGRPNRGFISLSCVVWERTTITSELTFKSTSERWRSPLSLELPRELIRLFSGPVFDDGKSLWHIDVNRNAISFLAALIEQTGEESFRWDRDYCAYPDHMRLLQHSAEFPDMVVRAIPRLAQPIDATRRELGELIPHLVDAGRNSPTGFLIRFSRNLFVFVEDEIVVFSEDKYKHEVVSLSRRCGMRSLPQSLACRPTIPGIANLTRNARWINGNSIREDDVTVEAEISLFRLRSQHWL